MVLIRAFGKFLQSNLHSTLKIYSDVRDSDVRDSDVRDGFIGAHEGENRDRTLDADVQNRKLNKSISCTLPAPQTDIPRCPDSA
jgi:hypothetical protein